MSSVLIGTSGYDYPEWKGVFYPADLPRKDFLSYYATQFNALELNNTFYNMPAAERMLSFYERSEGKLSFSVKANSLLTHQVTSTWKTAAEAFKTAVQPLQEKSVLISVLFQFPQSFHYTPENRFYLSALIKEFEGFPVAIEFRHMEWIRESVFAGLQERGAGIVFCDMPDLKNLPAGMAAAGGVPAAGGASVEGGAALAGKTLIPVPFVCDPNASSLFYIRMHGRNSDAWYAKDNGSNGSARYTYNYSLKELESFVPVIKHTIIEGKRPVVFFNNHPKGDGAKNAQTLAELLNCQL